MCVPRLLQLANAVNNILVYIVLGHFVASKPTVRPHHNNILHLKFETILRCVARFSQTKRLTNYQLECVGSFATHILAEIRVAKSFLQADIHSDTTTKATKHLAKQISILRIPR